MAKSREELVKEREQTKLATERAEHLKIAQRDVMRAGYMLHQFHERLEKGLFHIEDMVVCSGIIASVAGAQARIGKALATLEVQPAAPGEVPPDGKGELPAGGSGLIITE